MCCAALACLGTLAALGPANGSAAPGGGKPKKPKRPLVYLFVLDGLDRDAVTADGRAPFLSSLIADQNGANGAFFPNSLSVMVAETNPNHTSMITGAFPARHGIVGNAFATPGAGADGDSCPASPGGPPSVTTGESPSCLQAETAFTALERQAPDKRYTTALITGKPKLARLFATQKVTAGTYDADHIWAPCDEDEPYCSEVATDPISGYAADDSIVMDEVIRTTREGVGDSGFQRKPNFTFVNFPEIDGAGHTFGRTSGQYADAVSAGSAQIERFVDNQKALGLWRRTVMMVLSDHSMDDTLQSNRVSLQVILTLNGIPPSEYTFVGNGNAAHVYLTERNAPDAERLLSDMRAALISSSSIDQALYLRPNSLDGGDARTIAKATPAWGLGGERSGDIVVTTKPGFAILETSEASSFPLNPLSGNHGSTFTRDNFWLIAGGGKLVRKADSSRAVTNANAAPTALRVLGAEPPADAQANAAKQAFKRKALRRRSGKR